MLYHPSHHVPDLDEAEEFFARVFGRSSTRLSTLSDREPPEGWSNDYATFTPIADLLFDSIDPRRYQVAGRHLYEPVDEPQLKGMGWYVDDPVELYRSLIGAGYVLVDQMGARVDGDDPPTAAGARMPLFFTSPHDAGLRHELLPRIPFPLDHRLAEGWAPGVVDPADPLGIVCCAHHTIRTTQPDRALRLLVELLGGTVVHQGHDDLLDARATYVHLADTIIELVEDDDAVAEGHDLYTSIAFQVVDVDRAAAHLEANGVHLSARTERSLITVPQTSLGIAWRLADGPVPGDPRPLPRP